MQACYSPSPCFNLTSLFSFFLAPPSGEVWAAMTEQGWPTALKMASSGNPRWNYFSLSSWFLVLRISYFIDTRIFALVPFGPQDVIQRLSAQVFPPRDLQPHPWCTNQQRVQEMGWDRVWRNLEKGRVSWGLQKLSKYGQFFSIMWIQH